MKITFFAINQIIRSLLFTIIAIQPLVTAQVIFRNLPQYKINTADLLFFDITDTRKVISLNGEWKVYSAEDDKQEKISLEVPSIFQGKGEFVFEKSFKLTSTELNTNRIKLVFFGLNYTADISLNKSIIYRHSGGEYPFSIDLPRDLLKAEQDNLISVNLTYKLDSENTIPLKQRFLFPQNFGGIIRDVFLHLTPNINIKDLAVEKSINFSTKKTLLEIKSIVENKDFKKPGDTTDIPNNFTLKVKAYSPDGQTQINGDDFKFELKMNREIEAKQSITLNDPIIWSPETPGSYILRLELYRGDQLIDLTYRSVALYDLSYSNDDLLLNNKEYNLKGVTYIPSFDDFGSLASYSQMEKDIKIIKEAGFNVVRFSKSIPHPYYLRLCEELGLIAFIEIPISFIPEGLANNQNFMARSRNYIGSILKGYSVFSSIGAVGLGSSYMPMLDTHRSLITDLGEKVKSEYKLLTFISFIGFDVDSIENVDLYGVELFNTSVNDIKDELTGLREKLGRGRFFISEATYTVNKGQTDGFVNEFSYEAQAKYFDELFNFAEDEKISGLFINSMFDFKGDYPSLLSGYDAGFVYNVGLADQDRNLSRLPYKVVSARLNNAEKVTIPIGSHKDDAPMVFIILGLLLAISLGILVNSGRKFREDASRALLRPYNFFADVRDQRILSAYHSLFLAVIIAVTAALLTSNILYYLKTNIIFEKILLSFGSPNLMLAVSYFTWNPISALLWLSIFFIAAIVVLALVVRSASMFVKTKVYLSSAFFAIVWAFLPLVLFIPVGIIFYRLLLTEIPNIYLFIISAIFTLWLIYRLMKGIYVIYDVSPGPVYFYSILLFLLVFGGIMVYFQVNSSVIQHLMLTLKQFNIIG